MIKIFFNRIQYLHPSHPLPPLPLLADEVVVVVLQRELRLGRLVQSVARKPYWQVLACRHAVHYACNNTTNCQ